MGCCLDSQNICHASVGEVRNGERMQEKRLNPKVTCHRKSTAGDSDPSVDTNRKASGGSCQSLLLSQEFHSSLPGQSAATSGMLGQIMTGTVEVCDDVIHWRRTERKRRLLRTSLPVVSTSEHRVSFHSHLLLSAVSSSLNLLLSEYTVTHGIACAVTCTKGEEKKGSRGSGSKSSVKPSEVAPTRRSSRHSRNETEDSKRSESESTSATRQTRNNNASTSRGQQANNPRSGGKTRGRQKKVKVETHEEVEQEIEVGNPDEDGASEEAESEEKEPEQKDKEAENELKCEKDAEKNMEVDEIEKSPADNGQVSTDAENQGEEMVVLEEVVTKNVVEDEDNQIPSQEDSKHPMETELAALSPVQREDILSNITELNEFPSEIRDVESTLMTEAISEPHADVSNKNEEPESEIVEDDPKKLESTPSPTTDLKLEGDDLKDDFLTEDVTNPPPLQTILDTKTELDVLIDNSQTKDVSVFSPLQEIDETKAEPDTTKDIYQMQESMSSPSSQVIEDTTLEAENSNTSSQETSSLAALQKPETPEQEHETTKDQKSIGIEKQSCEILPSKEIAAPEIKDMTEQSLQDNTDPIPMECDSPASEGNGHTAESMDSKASAEEVGSTVTPAQIANQKPSERKPEGSKESKSSDKRERDGQSRKSRFHSPTSTWSPSRESRGVRSRRSRSRSRERERNSKTQSSSRNREHQDDSRETRRNRSRSRSRDRSRRRRSRSRNRTGHRSPSPERVDHGGQSPRQRDSRGGDGWRGRGGRDFRNSNWRNNSEKPGHFTSRDTFSSDNGNIHETSPEFGRNENPDWVKERTWQDADNRGRDWRREENVGDPSPEPWSRGNWGSGRGRGAHWSSNQQGEPGDNWRQRNSYSGTANNSDSYNRFNDVRGKRKESDGAEAPMDRSGWSSASSWAVRRTLPADVQNYYSRKDRGGGNNNNWNRQEEDQGGPNVPKQADPPPPTEHPAPPTADPVPAQPQPILAPPRPLLPPPMGVMGVMHYPMAPPSLQPRGTAQFAVPAPPVPVQFRPSAPLVPVQSIAVQGLPPPPPPPPLVQSGFTVVQTDNHPPTQVVPIFPPPIKTLFKPMVAKSVSAAPPPPPTGTLSGSSTITPQPSSITLKPSISAPQPSFIAPQPSLLRAQPDSSNKEKASLSGTWFVVLTLLIYFHHKQKLQIQERAINEVKAAIKPYYQKNEINKDEYKEIVRKAVEKVCHSKSGEVNTDKVANLVKAYVDKYKHLRKVKPEKS
ncbi:hypothetical protein DNTS_025598 [Danionella cerebrum]|uniref:SFR19-like C-terminal domain-containing protein n=1 Tax=Danionella cerebrum TaxID=2873325 RepID=A0A553RHY0_9TELE|nr:hypothetical protein DNTS_025598 [Danionella translucida]